MDFNQPLTRKWDYKQCLNSLCSLFTFFILLKLWQNLLQTDEFKTRKVRDFTVSQSPPVFMIYRLYGPSSFVEPVSHESRPFLFHCPHFLYTQSQTLTSLRLPDLYQAEQLFYLTEDLWAYIWENYDLNCRICNFAFSQSLLEINSKTWLCPL